MRLGKWPTVAVLLAGCCAVHLPQALAAWSVAGSGSGTSAATVMPTGTTPTASASGSTVNVAWTTATIPGGTAVAGYLINRYNLNGSAAVVGGTCSGVVTSTSCSETVPAGTWIYTDTPVQFNWTGTESPTSNSVTT